MENHRDGPSHAIPIFPFYWNRDVNSHSLNPTVWLKVNDGIVCMKENTYNLTQHSDLTEKLHWDVKWSLGCINKKTKKAAKHT